MKREIIAITMSRKNSLFILSIKDGAKKCCYCERSFELERLVKTIDHYIPLDKGGSNEDDNKVICCDECNKIKANLLPNEFLYIVACKVRWGEGWCNHTNARLKIIYKNLKAGVTFFKDSSFKQLPAKPKKAKAEPKNVDVNGWYKGEIESASAKHRRNKLEKGEISTVPEMVEPLPIDPISLKMKADREKKLLIHEDGYVPSTYKHINFHI